MDQHTHYRGTWAEINLDAINTNISSFRGLIPPDKELMAVVKANAYGHGAIQVAKEALSAGATWLAVSLLEEAIQLRKAGIEAPILLFGYLSEEFAPVAQQYRITISINETASFLEILPYVQQDLPPLNFHVKIDTGMSRQGISKEKDILQLISDYRAYQEKTTQEDMLLQWEGLYTHLATADEEDITFFEKQVAIFKNVLRIIKKHGVKLSYVHMENSAGIIRLPHFPDTNLVRLGISMYGLYPSSVMKGKLPFCLEPAFSLHTTFSLIKHVQSKTGVSYGLTYETEGEKWLGTLPIGYADGWSRRLSNQADVLVKGCRMKLVGRICMDQTIVELDRSYSKSERVTLIGGQEGEVISAEEVAMRLDTINYEIPCMISSRVPRFFLKNGKRVMG
jgi:alanine racemase